MKKKIAKGFFKYCDTNDLYQFNMDYAAENTEFEKALMARFHPGQTASGNKEDYVAAIKTAVGNHTVKKDSKYRKKGDFDADSVAEDLQPLFEKVNYYLRNKNVGEASLICQALIETIPDNLNGEDDLREVYDTAVDKLEDMMTKKILYGVQKQALFDWFIQEVRKTAKHDGAGFVNHIQALELYFYDTPEMLQKNLAIIDERFRSASKDEKADEAIYKIEVLQKAEMQSETEQAITRYICFADVRKMRSGKLIAEKRYDEAIELIQVGIKRAIKEKEPGTERRWKDELFTVYKLQDDTDKILFMAEDLLFKNYESKFFKTRECEYYDDLKKYTSKKNWQATLERLLHKMNKGFTPLKVRIFLEHRMWSRLFDICKEEGAEKIEEYEIYLRPFFARKILDIYQKYVEEQALIAEQSAYNNVARVLKQMKLLDGGEEVVNQLVQKYRRLYKKRRGMIGILEGM